jgi:hypothetical protein
MSCPPILAMPYMHIIKIKFKKKKLKRVDVDLYPVEERLRWSHSTGSFTIYTYNFLFKI